MCYAIEMIEINPGEFEKIAKQKFIFYLFIFILSKKFPLKVVALFLSTKLLIIRK